MASSSGCADGSTPGSNVRFATRTPPVRDCTRLSAGVRGPLGGASGRRRSFGRRCRHWMSMLALQLAQVMDGAPDLIVGQRVRERGHGGARLAIANPVEELGVTVEQGVPFEQICRWRGH